MTCDDFQIAFDQRHAGAPAAISSTDVDAHVATCAVCTAYAALSAELAGSISTEPLPGVETIVARAAATTRKLRRERIALPLFVSGVLVALQLATLDRSVVAILGGAVGGYVAGYFIFGWLMRRPLAALHALGGASHDDVLASWRTELDRRIRNERHTWWLLPALLVPLHVLADSTPYRVLEIAYAAALVVVLPLSVRRYRQLVRERAELG
jgi:hypothetical protein